MIARRDDAIMEKKNKLGNIILNVVLIMSQVNIAYANGAGMTSGNDTVDSTLSEIASILFFLGAAIAVGKLIQIGILFVMSSGSKRSDAKSALIPWAIGAIICVLFATIGSGIIDIIMGGDSGGVFDI